MCLIREGEKLKCLVTFPHKKKKERKGGHFDLFTDKLHAAAVRKPLYAQ